MSHVHVRECACVYVSMKEKEKKDITNSLSAFIVPYLVVVGGASVVTQGSRAFWRRGSSCLIPRIIEFHEAAHGVSGRAGIVAVLEVDLYLFFWFGRVKGCVCVCVCACVIYCLLLFYLLPALGLNLGDSHTIHARCLGKVRSSNTRSSGHFQISSRHMG